MQDAANFIPTEDEENLGKEECAAMERDPPLLSPVGALPPADVATAGTQLRRTDAVGRAPARAPDLFNQQCMCTARALANEECTEGLEEMRLEERIAAEQRRQKIKERRVELGSKVSEERRAAGYAIKCGKTWKTRSRRQERGKVCDESIAEERVLRRSKGKDQRFDE